MMNLKLKLRCALALPPFVMQQRDGHIKFCTGIFSRLIFQSDDLLLVLPPVLSVWHSGDLAKIRI